MANWMMNKVTVKPGGKKSVASFNEMLDVLDGCIGFNQIVPMPFQLGGEIVPAPNMPGLVFVSRAVEEWRIEHWGTKHDVSKAETVFSRRWNKASFTFETAWSPPRPVIQALSSRFPGLVFELKYIDPALDRCWGREIYKDGISCSEK